jgi:hypothetical protein
MNRFQLIQSSAAALVAPLIPKPALKSINKYAHLFMQSYFISCGRIEPGQYSINYTQQTIEIKKLEIDKNFTKELYNHPVLSSQVLPDLTYFNLFKYSFDIFVDNDDYKGGTQICKEIYRNCKIIYLSQSPQDFTKNKLILTNIDFQFEYAQIS